MKLNFKHNGSGVLNAIQRAINELAEWRDVQQDPAVDAAMGRTDQKLRSALQDIRDFQEGTLPQEPAQKRFILTCVTEEGVVIKVESHKTLPEARTAMRADYEAQIADAEAQGLEIRYHKLGDTDAEAHLGMTMTYDWLITETGIS